jgi:hypothetical protein
MLHQMLEESWAYQEMIEKGIIQGSKARIKQEKKQSYQQGIQYDTRPEEKKALQSVCLDLITARFPAILSLAQQQFNTLADINTLKTVLQKLFEVQTEEEARRYLLNVTCITSRRETS